MSTETVVQTVFERGSVAASDPAARWATGSANDARELGAATSVAETLDIVVSLARRRLGAASAGLMLAADGRVAAAVASGSQGRLADALQIQHHQGPGFQAIKGKQPVVSPEVRFDSRWRVWAPLAADLGVRSVLSLVLADGEPFGAVTLYSERRSYFGTASLVPGLALAQQASLAITVAVERERLAQSATSRGLVAQAQAILMERYQISADQALAVLRRSSAVLDQKLRSIAERIVGGRSLSDIDLLVGPNLAGASSTRGSSSDR